MSAPARPSRATGSAVARLARARWVIHLKIAGAVAIIGGLFGLIGLDNGLTSWGTGPTDWPQALGALGAAALCGAVAAAGVEARYRVRRRRLERR